MILTLSSESVRSTIFTNETGQVLYKTATPFKLGSQTTIIYKIQPNVDPADMHDRFEVMGEIEWHMLDSSKFRFNGKEMETKQFIPRHGWRGRKRTFTGPDGRPYRWDLQYRVVVLSLDDGSRTEVARSHRRSFGIIGAKRDPCLEVHPDAMHMLDMVVLTFIYVEKIRMQKEGNSRRPNGGGGP
ncbi:hypothetical protein HYDPIDRAFT_105340 [Hydnomerulius pinastri MD-312]|nr:hypothetical protein HYDPIDRAFT_105340 [Hydnomerulius pinastri MD-312]